jgi:predicted transcriptional regulator
MEGSDTSRRVTLVAEIVSSYMRYNRIASEDLPRLIIEVHRALESLGRGPPQPDEPPKPAVPIRRSITEEYVVCLECGFRARSLRRHLREKHGLEVDEYRARWELPPQHPLIASGYSARRSAIAKEHHFGRPRRAAVEPSPPPTEQPPSAEEAAPARPPRRDRRRPRR